MGTSKSENFSPEVNEMAQLFKALGHPARVAILEHLLEVNQCICGDLVAVTELAQPTVSQHLKELKAVGLIKGTIEGTSVCYCINEESIRRINNYFGPLLGRLTARSSCC